MKEEWRPALVDCGGPFVMIVGIRLMHRWFVVNLDMLA